MDAAVSSTVSTVFVGAGVISVVNKASVEVAAKVVRVMVVVGTGFSTRAKLLMGLGIVWVREGVKVKAAAVGARVKSVVGRF